MSWLNNSIVDWVYSGRQYFLSGETRDMGSYAIGYSFDCSITSDNGIYAFVYKKLGTKGLLLKNGTILREINRSYYQAEVYEYPAAFVTTGEGVTFLIHCPNEYCQIDFEEVETGEVITNVPNRKPQDFFHSRLEISPDTKTLISKGWGWHPYDDVELFDIEECIKNPLLLDERKLIPNVKAPICAASFINNNLILIGSSNDSEPFSENEPGTFTSGQTAIWNIETNEVSNIITPKFIVGGHLIAIDEIYAWELYNYPKIVNYRTGVVEDKIEEILTGQQVSSIIHHLENLPKIAFNKKTKQVAIAIDDKLEILTK
jgi:hypothetical protein